MGFFNLFGGSTTTTVIEDYLQNGAVVIDVRTEMEFAGGHVKGSKNIPLGSISSQIDKIKKLNKPIITCCRSGARSGSAESVLRQNGIDVINGGPWGNVDSCMK